MTIKIEEGWRFSSADFSVLASGTKNATGMVTLIRDPESRREWHKLPDELKDSENCPELYVVGHGKTIEEAIEWANSNARCSKQIKPNN